MAPFAAALAVVLATGVAVLATRWLPAAVPSGLTASERVPFLGGGLP